MPDYLGMFAVTAGIGADALARQFEQELDDYNAIMVKALADRLAEASAEYLHAQARRDWGYGEQEQLSLEDVDCREVPRASGRPTAIRPVRTTARSSSCSALLEAPKQGITLTEHAAMLPAASVSGLYFSHPQAKYFNIGRLGRDQVESYARRKGMRLEDVEKWLGPNLAYDPARRPSSQTPERPPAGRRIREAGTLNRDSHH